jgi:hypothetical protein
MAGGGATRLVVSSLRERGPALWGQLPGPGTHGRTDARSSSVSHMLEMNYRARSRCVNGGVFIIFIKYRSSNAIRAQHISMSEVQNKAEKSKRAQCAGDATGLVLEKLSLCLSNCALSLERSPVSGDAVRRAGRTGSAASRLLTARRACASACVGGGLAVVAAVHAGPRGAQPRAPRGERIC